MAAKVRPVFYFNATVRDVPGAAYDVLTDLASRGVNLLAFSAEPVGPEYTQLVLFPDDTQELLDYAARSGTVLNGPQRALLVQGDDELGALTGIHRKLADARVNVYASMGVTDGSGRFGYLLYVRDADFDQACRALGCG